MHRSYAENISLNTNTILISNKQEIHHIKDVLRLKKNDRLQIFNGNGEEAEGEIAVIKKEHIEIKILSYHKIDQQKNHPYLILACAVPKHTKFEWIIEKATELGVNEIIPLQTQRTEFHLNQDRADKKHTRYHTVAVNASKQSKRFSIPHIHPITPFADTLNLINDQTCAIIPCLLGERKHLHHVMPHVNTKKFIIFIGPEGDFTPEEVRDAVQRGAIPVTLGATVLKVETAALSALAFINLYSAETDPLC